MPVGPLPLTEDRPRSRLRLPTEPIWGISVWVSWNAAKRTLTEFGYSRVFWHPDGARGWASSGLELVPAHEAPIPDGAGQGTPMSRWIGRCALLAVGLAGSLGPPGLAQDMMRHVDLASPRMSQAEMTRAEVEAVLRAAPKDQPADLTDKSLNGLDLSGLDLGGADLRWARLNKANLKGARLAGARLELVWAQEADFSGTDLTGANLFQAQLARARLDGADLSRARIAAAFDNASLRGTRLRDADGAADMRNQSMGLMHASFRSAVLEQADLSGAKLARADFEFAKLAGAHLDGADLTRADLGGANLTGASVAGLDLSGADLTSAVLRNLVGRDRLKGLDATVNFDRAVHD